MNFDSSNVDSFPSKAWLVLPDFFTGTAWLRVTQPGSSFLLSLLVTELGEEGWTSSSSATPLLCWAKITKWLNECVFIYHISLVRWGRWHRRLNPHKKKENKNAEWFCEWDSSFAKLIMVIMWRKHLAHRVMTKIKLSQLRNKKWTFCFALKKNKKK